MSLTGAQARAEDVARAVYGKLIAMLANRTGDIIAAEDALADAFVSALKTWPERGIPDKPEAWLLTVAKNRRIDQARRDARLVITDEANEMADAQAIEPEDAQLDDRLKLLFVCAHPAIDEGIRTPLMLQTVLGLEAEQIAKAFLVNPSAMAQRLVRAKKKIKSAGIPFVVPEPEAYPERMGAVLEAVYGAYAVDWLEGDGDLSHEAFFLSNILAELAPENPEALGLTALIGFIEARRDARVIDGVLVPVPKQDVELWDSQLIERSVSLLTQASLKRVPQTALGRFQLEAAIQSVHAARSVTGKTDWLALSQLYAGLMHAYPSIGGAVSRAAVVAEDAGPSEGLRMLDVIDFAGLDTYQPFHAVRAYCLAEIGRTADAAEAYAKAISLCRDRPSKLWLEQKIAGLQKKMA
ncbi:sigma-70 family RNA polymerase sigma factor [uncultured Roseobacter sp.]|uniref:RNA polymerase sigma factor n=1 Tax=uncultured Roseobacter sp. TaxID=114847 RepID=UPI00262CA63B|nr:sigma-70 family RNA polymerase sigma factor [uncultured Roseobacter sp.]